MSEEKKEVSRRGYVKYAGAGIVVVAVAGAGAYYGTRPRAPATPTPTEVKPTKTEAKPTETPKPEGKRTVTVVTDMGVMEEMWMSYDPQVIEETGIGIDIVATTWGTQYAKVMEDFVTKTGAYDIIAMRPGVDFDFYPFLQPLDPYIEEFGEQDFPLTDYFPAFRKTYMYREGQIYALFYDGDTHLEYYRRDLWEHPDEQDAFEKEFGYELHPPITCIEYTDMAKHFTRFAGDELGDKGTLKEDFFGSTAVMGTWAGTWWWFERAAPLGLKYFDEASMDTDINKEFMEESLQSLIDNAPYEPPDQVKYEYPECRTAFLKDRAAQNIQWPCIGKAADGIAPYSESIIQGLVEYALVPGWYKADPTLDQRDPQGECVHRGGLPFCRMGAIPATSKKGADAYVYMQHHFNKHRLLHIGLETFGELKINTACDPCTTFQLEEQAKQWWNAQHYADVHYATWEPGTLWNGDIRWKSLGGIPDMMIPGYTEYAESLQGEINAAYVGSKSAKDALDNAAKLWNEITDRRGRDKQKREWEITVESYKDYLGAWP
jgi:multiple sugar transport system substrate-binding protein